MSLFYTILYSNLVFLFTLIAVLYIKWDLVRIFLLQLLKNKFGLVGFDTFKISFDSRKRLAIYISGVELRRVQHAPSPNTTFVSRFMSSHSVKTILGLILDIPVHLIMATLANYVSLHIHLISFQFDDMLLQIEHIQFDSELTKKQDSNSTANRLFHEKVFTIKVNIGPTTLKLAEKSVIDVTTLCSLSISCHFRARRLFLKDLDLDVQVGKTMIDVNTCMGLIREQKSRRSPSPVASGTQPTIRWEDLLNTIRFRIQSAHFNYVINKEIVTNFDICNIALFFSSVDGRPACQLHTGKISYFLAHHRLVLVPNMEINISLPEEDLFMMPSTDLVSIVWVINSPILQIPFQSKIVQETLKHIHASLPTPAVDAATTENQVPQKQISDLPMCHLAIILNSPKLVLAKVSGLYGYMSSQSLIVRLSGEYILKGRNSNYDDVPSSSSSSSTSHLDTLFAREEYTWLSYTSSSSSPEQKRHSIHAFDSQTETPKRQRQLHTANRLRSLMGRVSSRRHHHQHHHVPTEQQKRPTAYNKKWNYKLSLKVILQRASMGYEDDDGKVEEFVRIKHAVIIAKSNMNVVQHSDNMERYCILFALGNTIHSEAAIDKPMICVCQQDTAMSASIFWLHSVPHTLQSQYLSIFAKPGQQQQQQQKRMSPKMQLLVKSLRFSLDVTEGSIIAWSVDRGHQKQVVPDGYIDNTPTHNIYTRIQLDTQKFTFVYEGTELILDQSQWRSRCHLEKLYIHQSSTSVQETSKVKELLEKDEKQHLILWISQLNFGTNNYSRQPLHLTAKIKKIGISYSVRNHYACLLFIKSLVSVKEKLGSSTATATATTHAAPEPSLGFHLDATIGRADIQIGLPFEKKLYLRLDEFKCQQQNANKPSVQFRNMMILGASPLHKNKWEQLVELDQVQIATDMHPVTFSESQIDVRAKKIFVTVPYKFVLSAVLDSVIGLVKAIKELQARLLNDNDDEPTFTYFGPRIKNDPVAIPHIKLRTKLFSIYFDDDPFEARLRNIVRTGLAEQQRRLAYESALEAKVYDMPQENDDDMQHIRDAQTNLMAYFSEFWIKHINKTKNEEAQFYTDLFSREHYRNAASAAAIDKALDDGDSLRRHGRSKTFIIDVLPRPTRPPLAGFSAHYAKVYFKRAELDTRNFIHHIGGGVPFEDNFSIIVPFHLSIKAGKTWIKARDYPLPLLYIPPLVQSSEEGSRTSWTLEGNYVAADELGNSGGSRIIPISIIPSKSEDTAPGYCLSAVRTTSPLKFYSVVDYHILSQDMSMISWSVSYSPVIQDILRVLDTLTAAQVDPSPRIGFWDKVRFMIHSRINIHFTGGGDLAFVVKGTRDPYLLKGRGAGIAKVWSSNVLWLLGQKNKQNEFMQIISDRYALGVPDLVRGGFVPDVPDVMTYTTENSDRHRFSKVALKLTDGIRMGIGLSYERRACDEADDGVLCFSCENRDLHVIDMCRSQVFLPHYKVLFQSVEQVNKHHEPGYYDAFKGFRSDFIHLSFSIVKLENDVVNQEAPDFSKDDPYFDLLGMSSHNSMHLSPCFLEHFLEWYRMFGSPVSLPIRQGKLFPTDEPKARSFGELLNTIKYKIVVDPLAIGMFFTDLETYLKIKGGGSVGLKARVSSFSVDLHQRRQVTKSPAKTEISLHEAEVQLTDIDLRVIKAIHYRNMDHEASSATTRSYPKSTSESIPYSDARTEATSSFSAEDTNSSFQWIDSKDYVILDSVARQLPHYSKTEVFPFAYSPLFHYVRQIDEQDTEKREYLRQTHDCIFGKGIESQEFQRAYMDRRANELSKVIEDHDKQLDIILHAIETYTNSPKELQAEYDILLKKIEYLQKRRYMLHAYLAQLILETELNAGNDRDSPLTSASSICRKDEMSRWQMLMGHFKDRYFIHYPQIILNNSVREALVYLKTIHRTRSVQHFNLSARCLKFLEELVQAAEKQKQWTPDASEPTTDKPPTCSTVPMEDVQSPTDDRDKDMTEALIEKLLSERRTHFVAYNEKEEHQHQKADDPTTQMYEGTHVFENNSSKNFDDPDYQYQSIPDFYRMTSDYLVDLIHPQVVFQSNQGLDHLVLLTNERVHIKGFNIMDNNNSSVCDQDKDMYLVKKRVVASFDNAQLLIAKKIKEVESYSSLAQNCYGQFQEKHWAVWTQPELLWSCQDATMFENFQRVSSQLTGSMQYDYFNHLRIKVFSRESPFEDRTDTTQLHLPQFKITLNSQQGHILYYTLTDLVLGRSSSSSPKAELKLDKSREVMLAAERSDLSETVEQVRVLQNRSRHLLHFYRQFRGELSHMDQTSRKEFHKNKRRMRESLDNLYLIVEAIRSIHMFRKDIHVEDTDDATRFIFTSGDIVWEAMLDYATNSSLCKCILKNTHFVLLNKPNGSSRTTMDIDRMQIKNTTDAPVFNNVLDAYLEPSNPVEPDYARYKMISGILDTLPPVGGISIIQHLEINLLPLNIQLSTLFFALAMDYFFPHIVQANGDPLLLQDTEDIHDEEGSCGEEDASSYTSLQQSARSPPKREGSFISFDSLKQSVKNTISRKRKVKADELTVMKTRSSTNRTFIFVRIPSTKHCISIQGPSENTIYNIYNFMFKQPNLEYRNVTWTMAEMTETIKKEFKKSLFKQSPALLKKYFLANNKESITNVTSNPQVFPVDVRDMETSAPSSQPPLEIDLMNDSVIYNKHDITTDDEKFSTSYNTEDDCGDEYSYNLEETKSLYSNEPEEEQERLIELQVANRGSSYNVDERLSSVYLKKHRRYDDTNELIEKGRILFGSRYNGPTH